MVTEQREVTVLSGMGRGGCLRAGRMGEAFLLGPSNNNQPGRDREPE